VDRLAANEKAAVERHEEVLRRLDAQDRAIARIADQVRSAREDIEDLHYYTAEALEIVAGTINATADFLGIPPQGD
jgi:hypothetical protein